MYDLAASKVPSNFRRLGWSLFGRPGTGSPTYIDVQTIDELINLQGKVEQFTERGRTAWLPMMGDAEGLDLMLRGLFKYSLYEYGGSAGHVPSFLEQAYVMVMRAETNIRAQPTVYESVMTRATVYPETMPRVSVTLKPATTVATSMDGWAVGADGGNRLTRWSAEKHMNRLFLQWASFTDLEAQINAATDFTELVNVVRLVSPDGREIRATPSSDAIVVSDRLASGAWVHRVYHHGLRTDDAVARATSAGAFPDDVVTEFDVDQDPQEGMVTKVRTTVGLALPSGYVPMQYFALEGDVALQSREFKLRDLKAVL